MHTFVDPLYRAQRLFAGAISMVSGEVRLTYAETWSRCRRLAGGVTRLGLEPGERVAILAANSHRYLEVYLAVPASGLVVVPLNTRHAEPELRYALEDSGTRLLITDRDPGGLARTVEQVLSLPDDYERLLASAPEADLGEGVMLTHRNLIANTINWLVAVQLGPEHTFLIVAPMFHAAGSVAVLATMWIGGRHVTGYWNKPEATAAVLRHGWYYSGDLGFINEQGYLFLVDRAKDMIIAGGENVYSTEVEEVLCKHPAVLEAAVFGVPDQKWGEAVHAVAGPRPGHAVDAPMLIAFCRAHIGGYKVPKQIDLQGDPLPKSGPGKVLKRELRAPFWAAHAAQIH